MDNLDRRLASGLRDIAHQSRQSVASSLEEAPRAAGRSRRLVVPAVAGLAILLTGGVVAMLVSSQHDRPDSVVAASTEGRATITAPAPNAVDVDRTADRVAVFSDRPGFGKTVVDYNAGTVTVFWKGQPPAEVMEVARRGDNGVNVVLAAAQYSAEELTAAGKAAMLSDPKTVVAATASPDMSGLVVDVLRTWTGSAESLRQAAGVPVTVRIVEERPVDLGGSTAD